MIGFEYVDVCVVYLLSRCEWISRNVTVCQLAYVYGNYAYMGIPDVRLQPQVGSVRLTDKAKHVP